MPRNNKFYSFIVHLKHNYRYGLTLALCALLVCLWMAALHFPLQYAMSHTKKEIKHLQNQFQLCDQASGSCIQLADTIESIKVEVNKHSLDTAQSAQDAMLFVINQAQKNNLTVVGCNIENDVDQQWYVEHAITFDVNGEFNHLIKFFESIQNTSHMIALKQFNLARSSETQFNLKGVFGVMERK